MGDSLPFWTVIESHGDATALLDCTTGSVTTYRALCDSADGWATALTSIAGGIRKPVVAIEIESTFDGIAAYLGALRADCAVLIGEPGTLGADSVVAQTYRPDIVIARDSGALKAGPGEAADGATAASPHADLCILLSTSGSTGDPKLVRLSHTNIASNAEAIATYLDIRADDRAMLTLPLHYSYGLSVLHSHLARGASVALTARSVTDPEFHVEVGRYAPTSMALVPHQVDVLATLPFERLPTSGMRYITQAGGKLDPALVRQFKAYGDRQDWALVIMYGQTEAAPRISYVPPELLPAAAGSIGRAIPGGRLWLRDSDGRPIDAADRPGELIYEGPNVMMGYAATRDDLARGAELTELATGDIAERDAAGLYRIVGRLSRFVKLFGLRLSLDQIEALLRERGIEGFAVAVDDHLVLLCRDATQCADAREIVAERYALPLSAVHAGGLTDVPLLSNGKVDMSRLRHFGAQAIDVARERDAGSASAIRDALAAATRSKIVRPTDSFNELGGDSLSYLQLQMIIEDRIGYVPDGWETMPLAALEALEQGSGRTQRTISKISLDVPLRLIAISMVVAEHATDYPLFGGPWILLAIMGFSAAKFQISVIARGRPWALGMKMLYPILPLYLLILALYGVSRGSVPLSNIVLLGNYHIWAKGTLLEPYWFVSLYCQIVALLMLLAAIPPLRRAVANHGWAAAAVLTVALAAAILPTLGGIAGHVSAFPVPHVATWGLLESLPIFACGWMLQAMRGRVQAVVSAAIAILLCFVLARLPVMGLQLTLVAMTFAVLAIDAKLPVCPPLNRWLQRLAGVTLFVYLFHEIIVFALMKLHLPQGVRAIVAIVLAFIAATLVKLAFDLADRTVSGRVARRS